MWTGKIISQSQYNRLFPNMLKPKTREERIKLLLEKLKEFGV